MFNSLSFLMYSLLDTLGSEMVTFLCPWWCRTDTHKLPIIPAPVTRIFWPTLIGFIKSHPCDRQEIGSVKAAVNCKILILLTQKTVIFLHRTGQ